MAAFAAFIHSRTCHFSLIDCFRIVFEGTHGLPFVKYICGGGWKRFRDPGSDQQTDSSNTDRTVLYTVQLTTTSQTVVANRGAVLMLITYGGFEICTATQPNGSLCRSSIYIDNVLVPCSQRQNVSDGLLGVTVNFITA